MRNKIEWMGVPENETAIEIMPWKYGITITKQDHDGTIYGCRDVSASEHAESITLAWIEEAKRKGLKIVDRTPRGWQARINDSLRRTLSGFVDDLHEAVGTCRGDLLRSINRIESTIRA